MVLLLLEDELKRLGEALMERSEASPSDSESARGWHYSKKAWLWSEQRLPRCMPSSRPRQYGQSQKMLKWLKKCGQHP